MNRFFFLEIGLDLRRVGPFRSNALEKSFDVRRGKWLGCERGSPD